MTDSVTLISRRSALAMWQTNYVADLLRAAHDGLHVEIVGVDTTGDKVRDKPLPAIGGKGLFTKELEDGLLAGEVDIAVHSLKDLPTTLPDGLIYAGSPQRAAASDCLVTPHYTTFSDLPDDATIATGSVRRRAQLRAQKPGLRFVELRGNIDTRLRKLRENGWDAVVMATAALHRLDRPELVAVELDVERFVPAPAQGAIGLEIREDREDLRALLEPVIDSATIAACLAERTLMRRLEGGCSVPLAAHCRPHPDGWELRGWIGSLDASAVLHSTLVGPDPIALAESIARDFAERGASEILGS